MFRLSLTELRDGDRFDAAGPAFSVPDFPSTLALTGILAFQLAGTSHIYVRHTSSDTAGTAWYLTLDHSSIRPATPPILRDFIIADGTPYLASSAVALDSKRVRLYGYRDRAGQVRTFVTRDGIAFDPEPDAAFAVEGSVGGVHEPKVVRLPDGSFLAIYRGL